ncbi:hypothetical protein J6590_068525 [Homalodisca vitripennis]|nr:hypothetical protein J6590_068525 [Homalodisca vitripennis]
MPPRSCCGLMSLVQPDWAAHMVPRCPQPGPVTASTDIVAPRWRRSETARSMTAVNPRMKESSVVSHAQLLDLIVHEAEFFISTVSSGQVLTIWQSRDVSLQVCKPPVTSELTISTNSPAM